ncbi:B-cell CLL/lymphoma 9-like protein isoform X1 [Periophthalmus magnuspinnatus]|uniref:B-cell CLL/lymphoma 9-like protein isoform X1 n=1 Tax=Periophthalmus magnuspinnatus TaxID=409849 RepID=UPI00145B35DD|nr:B-cell CLL/lymphoma 9-like protein isoform X1 [Periophthalmus magnuspinnatus]XP_055081771.1 B-cell CLL/lymphoma 9-like protein isoform X1 [Periophthalmus magnuspinnatus]XP_055081773.1 B-cell CLL/lymphoma 9-like protein isoform X1 [Periophthalmus magnuspinnatus]
MHTDNKLANHGKQVSSESQSHNPIVNQQAQQQQGPKGVGGNGVKSSQVSPGSHALKSVSQSVSSAGGMLKTKTKRERSVSMDSDERHVRTSVESDAKGEGIMRSKRRCVLERKQPYSGDEWCSGPDTEEDEEKPQTLIHREKTMVGPVPGLRDLKSEPGPEMKVEPKQTLKQLVYVFTTSLANSAADAVLKGQSDSILLFHQQNVPRSKLEQAHPARKKTSNMPEKVRSSSSPPSSTPKSQSGTPRPSSAGVMGMALRVGTPPSSTSEIAQTRTSEASHTSFTRLEGGSLPADQVPATRDGESVGGMVLPIPTVSPSQSPTVQSIHPQSAQAPRLCPENLSKEQLEHRERSLQTLRDIERLFLRSATNAGPGDPDSTSNHPNNLPSVTERSGVLDGNSNGRAISGSGTNNNVLSSSPMGNMRKYEEPLQSIISQTESLRGPPIEHHDIDHPHHQMSPSGVDIGHLLGPDGLTPEQIAWRKLQEEYYQEKRRQQEIQPPVHSENYRVSEMGMPGGPMMMRGPPPPYHSKPGEQQWANNMMGGGVRGNTQILDIPEGPQGPRFLGHISRGPPAGGFPGSPGPFPLDGVGHQRATRPGMLWLDEMPNNKGPGSQFQGLYTGGPPQHLQSNIESSNHLIAREEIFNILEKRQMQGLPRSELVRLAKQLQFNMQRPNRVIRRGTPSQNDSMDFPGSHVILGSPGAGPQIKDLVDSPLGSNNPLNMKQSINVQQHQQLNLTQKLRSSLEVGTLSEIFGPAAMSQARNSQNRREENRGFNPGPDGPFHFPNPGPFTGGHVEGPYLQTDSEMFEEQGPNQMGGTMRLSHMPMTEGFKGPDARARHPSDPTLNLHPLASPSLPAPHQLNSPSMDQVPSPLLPSSSGAGIKSPSQMSSGAHQPPLPPASGAGTPSSIKSPQVVGSSTHGLHSPSASPGQLKSPAVSGAAGSPGWTSPKPALPSSGPASGKMVGNGGPSLETGQSLPPRSSSLTPISQPGCTNTSVPFTSSTEAPPSQNPLSLIMSQMSKYAMPSSTPLYHEAIKTLASSDDEMLPDRPLLSGVCIGGNTQVSQLLGPEPQSPISHGQQQLSHDATGPMLSSPNQMALSSMNSVIGAGAPDGIVSSLSQNQMGGFPRLQPHGPLHSPVGAMVQNFTQSNDNILPPQQLHMISKGHPHQRPSDSFNTLPMGNGPDLSEVIRPTHTGIPEFDLSRIIPCDKPSSILQYFPKSNTAHQNPSQGPPSQHSSSQQLLKQLSSSIAHSSGPSSNPHIANLQNMMAEQQLQPLSHSVGRQGMGASRGMVSGAGIGPMCPPGHMMGRPAMSLQQQQHGMMPNNTLHHSANPYQGIMPSQQHSHNTMAQHNMMMMMQAKQQGLAFPGDPFGPQGPLMCPQGPMMGPPQPGMMGPQSIRQRGTPLDSPISYGSGGMANIPF